ncbi:serine protease snake-like, partial [Musca vetustissima]|uniref:serine protease snake-like n=1 Tax=Musca vetustissima TaxID=27455 RepID=UPI002AB766F7
AALGWDSAFAEGSYDYKCGGVLVWDNYVLTAAHCAILTGIPPSVVLVGGTNLTDSKNKPIKVAQVIQHPMYNPKLPYHDIALIKLKKSAIENRLCIWTLYEMDDLNVTTVGYGHIMFGGPPSESLLKTHLTIVPNKDCTTQYMGDESLPLGILDSQLCAKDFVRRSDTCQADSGGPLILRSKNYMGYERAFVVGITAFGDECGFGKAPGVYTRVSEYIDWIESIIFQT